MQESKINYKIIIMAIAIVVLALLPWLLSRKYSSEIHKIADDIAPAMVAGLKEAMYYEELGGGLVECQLCPNRCLLNPGQTGTCRVRENIDGKLYSLSYGKPVTIHVDPIEKKPLFHFLPGANAFSLATVGCNLSCSFCQNWNISQAKPGDFNIPDHSPEEVVRAAKESGAQVIAFTYSEPIVFYEYVIDISRLAKDAGLKTVMISGGYINREPLLNLLPYLDGIKIDLKSFSDEFYKKLTNGRLEPVLNTIKTIADSGKHLEIVYLVIPGENDSEEEIAAMTKWLVENAGPDTILHFSRFHPDYKMLNRPPTPEATIKRAREQALAAGLKYVYTGNMPYPEGESTFCADGSIAIKRQGYFIKENRLNDGRCEDGTIIPGVWE